MRSLIWILGIALIVILLLFIALYGAVMWQSKHDAATSARKRIGGMGISIFALLVVLFSIVAMSAAAVLGIQAIERKQLFQPTRIDRYTRVAGIWYPLSSGGGVLHLTPNAAPNTRRILFLHGNSLNLDSYAEALEKFATLGYSIYALEYAGYGPTKKPDDGPSCKTVMRDAFEAWELVGNSDTIVVGFSLGGALLGQIYEQLNPLPAQIVFLNTFWSVCMLVETKLGDTFGQVLAPLLQTQWITRAPTTFKGSVVVVYTADDLVVPPKHGEQLCQVFSQANLRCIRVPYGGHRLGTFRFLRSWAPSLLPPVLSGT
jgi:hypothetical protein